MYTKNSLRSFSFIPHPHKKLLSRLALQIASCAWKPFLSICAAIVQRVTWLSPPPPCPKGKKSSRDHSICLWCSSIFGFSSLVEVFHATVNYSPAFINKEKKEKAEKNLRSWYWNLIRFRSSRKKQIKRLENEKEMKDCFSGTVFHVSRPSRCQHFAVSKKMLIYQFLHHQISTRIVLAPRFIDDSNES